MEGREGVSQTLLHAFAGCILAPVLGDRFYEGKNVPVEATARATVLRQWHCEVAPPHHA